MEAEKQEKQKSIYAETWCKELIYRLGRYKKIKARMETLEIMLDRSTYPSAGVISSYGEKLICPNFGEANGMELEHRELKWEMGLLDAALNGLKEIYKAVILLRFTEGASYWHITDIYLPKRFRDKSGRPLFVSERTVKGWIIKSLIEMGENLGYIGKLHENCTKSAPEWAKKEI